MLEFTLVSGVLFGLYFSLMALGLNLVFGVMQVVNLAHGDFLMLGAFAAYFAYTAGHVNPLMAVIVVAAGFLLLGFLLYFPLIPRLLRSHDPEMLSLILFFGVSQVLEAVAVIAFGNNPRSVELSILGARPVAFLGHGYQASWLVSATVSLLAIGIVYGYLYGTRLGYATRAIMGDREEAASSGVPVHRVSALAFGIGLSMAAVSGALSPLMLGSIFPTMGLGLTVTAFAVIVIGSLGNPLGTVLGGLVYGVSLLLMQTYFSSWSNLVPYLLLIVILLVKPSGLLGKGMRRA